jgi:hypothetical protein
MASKAWVWAFAWGYTVQDLWSRDIYSVGLNHHSQPCLCWDIEGALKRSSNSRQPCCIHTRSNSWSLEAILQSLRTDSGTVH